jgi:hypothetical protein
MELNEALADLDEQMTATSRLTSEDAQQQADPRYPRKLGRT